MGQTHLMTLCAVVTPGGQAASSITPSKAASTSSTSTPAPSPIPMLSAVPEDPPLDTPIHLHSSRCSGGEEVVHEVH